MLKLPKIIAGGVFLMSFVASADDYSSPPVFSQLVFEFLFLFQAKELSCCEAKSYGFNRKNLEGSLFKGQMVQRNVPPPNATSSQGPSMVGDVCNRLSSQTISKRPSSMRISLIVGGAP